MKISFNSRNIREICENTTLAEKTYGKSVASFLRKRLADLSASTSLDDFPLQNLILVLEGNIELRIGNDHTLVISQNHVNCPTLPDGSVNWSMVSSIKILKIVNNDK